VDEKFKNGEMHSESCHDEQRREGFILRGASLTAAQRSRRGGKGRILSYLAFSNNNFYLFYLLFFLLHAADRNVRNLSDAVSLIGEIRAKVKVLERPVMHPKGCGWVIQKRRGAQ
jgi:hypothetical protein